MSPVDPNSYSLTPWPFSDSDSTPWLFIDPLHGRIDPWGSISTTLRTTGSCTLLQQPVSLTEVHERLCHPGVQRLIHYVRQKNLPFSVQDIKQACRDCRGCAEVKPRFTQPPGDALVKALRPSTAFLWTSKAPFHLQGKCLSIYGSWWIFAVSFCLPMFWFDHRHGNQLLKSNLRSFWFVGVHTQR